MKIIDTYDCQNARMKYQKKTNGLYVLVPQYKDSLKLLDQRVKYLKAKKEQIKNTSPEGEKDPEYIELQERLKPLIAIRTELANVAKEVAGYYNPSWWRSPEYTMNQRKSRTVRFTQTYYD